MTLMRPWLLLLLLALPLWWWRRRHAKPGTPYSNVGLAAAVARPAWWVRLPVWLRSVAVGAWIVAAAGPRVGGDRVELKREGIAIVITIDISSSMLAEDFAPSNRLEVAKRQAIAFVQIPLGMLVQHRDQGLGRNLQHAACLGDIDPHLV